MNEELQSRLKYGGIVGGAAILVLESMYIPTIGTWIGSVVILLATYAVAQEAKTLLPTRLQCPLLYAVLPPLVVMWVWQRLLGDPIFISALLLLILLLFGALAWASREEVSNESGYLLSGLLIGAAGLSGIELTSTPYGIRWLTVVIAVTVAADCGAFAAGRIFKGPKLAYALSPGKTVSGLIGGVLFATLIGILLGCALLEQPSALVGVVCGIVALVGAITDLIQSRIKRIAGVKNSGTALGAHGGVFDRIDSHLEAFIALVLLLHLIH